MGTVFVGHRSAAEVVHKNRPLWGILRPSINAARAAVGGGPYGKF